MRFFGLGTQLGVLPQLAKGFGKGKTDESEAPRSRDTIETFADWEKVYGKNPPPMPGFLAKAIKNGESKIG